MICVLDDIFAFVDLWINNAVVALEVLKCFIRLKKQLCYRSNRCATAHFIGERIARFTSHEDVFSTTRVKIVRVHPLSLIILRSIEPSLVDNVTHFWWYECLIEL